MIVTLMNADGSDVQKFECDPKIWEKLTPEFLHQEWAKFNGAK